MHYEVLDRIIVFVVVRHFVMATFGVYPGHDSYNDT